MHQLGKLYSLINEKSREDWGKVELMVSICLITRCKYKKQAGVGSCFVDFCYFSYFFSEFFRILGWIRVLFWEFLQFQLLFPRIFPDFGLRLGAVLEVLGISAPSFAYYAINQSFCSNVCHDRSISIFCDVLKNIALSVKSGNIIIKCQYLTHK